LLNDAEIVLDEEKIWLIECNVKTELVNMVYSGGVVPTVYIMYHARLLMVRRLWEQRQEQKALDRRGLLPLAVWQRREEAPHRKESHCPSPQPTVNCATPSGTTFGGRGCPMDLDAICHDAHCYQCGVLSHFKRDCPELRKAGAQQRKFSIHALLMDLSADKVLKLKELLLAMDQEDSPQAGPSADADNVLDFL
jgi:hypothetical protein